MDKNWSRYDVHPPLEEDVEHYLVDIIDQVPIGQIIFPLCKTRSHFVVHDRILSREFSRGRLPGGHNNYSGPVDKAFSAESLRQGDEEHYPVDIIVRYLWTKPFFHWVKNGVDSADTPGRKPSNITLWT